MQNVLNSQNVDPLKNKEEIGLKGIFNPISSSRMEETLRMVIKEMDVSMFQNLNRETSNIEQTKEPKPVMKFDTSSVNDKYYKKITSLDEEIRRLENGKTTSTTQEKRIEEPKIVIPIETKRRITLSEQTTQRAINSTHATTLGVNSYYKRVSNLESAIKEIEIRKRPTLVVEQTSFKSQGNAAKTTTQVIQYDSIVKRRDTYKIEQSKSGPKSVQEAPKSKVRQTMTKKAKEPKPEKAKQPRAKKEKEPKPEKVKQPRVKKEKEPKPEKVKQPRAKKEKEPKPEKAKQPRAKKEKEPKPEKVKQPRAKKEKEPKPEKAKQPRAKKEKEPKPEKVKQPRAKKEEEPKAEKVKQSRTKKEKEPKPEKAKQPRAKKEKELKPKKTKKEVIAREEKRTIKKANTIEDPNRLTEPKKRGLLTRIILQMKYDTGKYEFIEDEYLKGEISKEELEFYKNSDDRYDRKYYKEVQEYEDITKDVVVSGGWMTFKLGLATALLAGTLAVSNNVIQGVKNSVPTSNEQVEITLENASQEQLDAIKQKIDLIKTYSNYNFENLTEEEQILGVLKIKEIVKGIGVRTFQGEFLRGKDQEFLEEILIKAFEDEYSNYSDDERRDLKKLAFELLPQEKKQYIRDPQVLIEIEQKNQNRETAITEDDERDL